MIEISKELANRRADLVAIRGCRSVQTTFWLLFRGVLVTLSMSSVVVAEFADQEFTLKVLPLFKAKCFGCHGDDPDELKGSFDMTRRDALLEGGESEEPAVVPGQPEKSPLLLAVRWEGIEMPPKENDRLDEEQIDLIRRWIAAGAPWPSESAQKEHRQARWSEPVNEDGILVATSGGLSDDWTYRRYQPENVWAFRPLRTAALPNSVDHTVHPVDYFVHGRLQEAGFEPAPPADPATLIRRATYDLIGLPPQPDEVEAFLAEWEQDPDTAWHGLIDRLLESPHYGERWAQHWLDVVRYADTGGYSNDYERSNAWRYRDYVIRSFNDDKPYDQFVVEQIAGDELADAAVRERSGGAEEAVQRARLTGDYTAEAAEWIVATGFLRMGPWDNAMVKAAEARQIYLDDVVNSVGQAFLSTTMRCVKCHDHKFDPIPTRDYYRMYAAFATTQMAERATPFLDVENRQWTERGEKVVREMLDFAKTEKDKIKEKQEDAAKAWFAERGLEYIPETKRQDLPDEEKPPRYVGLNHVDEGQLKVREQDEWIWNRRLERYQPMAQSIFSGADGELSWNNGRKLRIPEKTNPAWRPDSRILMGGSLEAAGEEVAPGVLSAPGIPVAGQSTDPFVLPDGLDGRRLPLARWIVDPQNPLTPRSIVNRVWQYHFVHGIARNPNNFGATGAHPTHPELLDWMAADFVRHGWTFKRLHRLIMTSEAYRQAGSHPQMERLRTSDPDNHLLAYYPPRRLSAEELRDSLLAVSGELNPMIGGLPVMPEMNMEVALQPRMIQFSIAPAYQPSPTQEQRNRRTIYAYRVRGQADPFLETFNQPNPNDSCELRDTASVTPQAFTLLNSEVITDRSIAFASRLQRCAQELAEKVEQAFRFALGRRPDQDERTRLIAYVRDMQSYHQQRQPRPASYPQRITRSLVEEFSGQPFEYEEILPIFEDYQADLKPHEVSAETRALADLCLLLFNSNEFIYVY